MPCGGFPERRRTAVGRSCSSELASPRGLVCPELHSTRALKAINTLNAPASSYFLFTGVRRRGILRTSPLRTSTKFARGFGRWHHAYDGKGYPPLREAGGRRRRDHALHDHVPHPVDKGNDSEGFDRGCRIQVASLADHVS